MAGQRRSDDTVQDQIFDRVQRTQESIIDATRNVADGMSDLVPAPREHLDRVLERTFDVAEHVLRIPRDAARRVVTTVTPAIGGQPRSDRPDPPS